MTSGISHGTDQRLDRWEDWLVRGRDRGASEAQIHRTRRALARIRNRVLREARLQPGERVVDLGAGTGLLALETRNDAHAEDWWGTLVGWDERELIGWSDPVPAPDEVKEITWMETSELSRLIDESPERIFTFQLPVLEYYLRQCAEG